MHSRVASPRFPAGKPWSKRFELQDNALEAAYSAFEIHALFPDGLTNDFSLRYDEVYR